MKNQSKDKLLYFADDEIITGKTDNKKVFVTKRINGKETHVKQDIQKIHRETEYKRVPNTQGFNFEREIVIGVNSKKSVNNKSFNVPKNTKGNSTSNRSVQKDKKVKSKNKKRAVQKSLRDKESKISKNTRNISQGKKVSNKYYEDFDKMKKNKKKQRNNKAFITVISILFMIISLVIMAFLTPLFSIQEIKIEGNNKVTASNIINLSRVRVGQNIFRNNKGKIEKYIKENSYIEDVEIKRVLPSTMEIKVVEREVQYQIQLISSYIYIDKKGNILENAETKEKAIVLEGISTTEEELLNGKRLNSVDIEKIEILNKITSAINQIEGIEMSEVKISVKRDNDIVIYLNSENKKIYIGDGTNLSNKMLYIKKILENEKENSGSIFINGDLNEGFKPYFREEEYIE